MVIGGWGRNLRNGFRPSRQRYLQAIISTTASGAQSSGATLPTFLQRGLTPDQALQIARTIDPSQWTLDLAFSQENKRNFQWIADDPKVAKSKRHLEIRELTKLEAKLKPLQVKLGGTLNPQSPARSLRIPLIAFLDTKLCYADKSLPSDLTDGVSITGTIAPSQVLAHRSTPATERFATLKKGLKTRNRCILRSPANTKRPVIRTKCWELPWVEHEKGGCPSLWPSRIMTFLTLSSRPGFALRTYTASNNLSTVSLMT